MALEGRINRSHAETLKRLSRFGLVGGLGFIVDAGLTITLIKLGLSPFSSRLIAMALATLVTWRLNRAITFDRSNVNPTAEGLRYSVVALVAALANYSLFVVLVLTVPTILPVFAIASATGFSMLISYLGFAHFTFRTRDAA